MISINRDDLEIGRGISFAGAIKKIKKTEDPLQPIYEAFTNSLEAIKSLPEPSDDNYIKIKLNLGKTIVEDKFDFISIEIEDSGIGFNDVEYNRFIDLNDTTKGFNNRGTGRVQFLHSFEKTDFSSIYKINDNHYRLRKFALSQNWISHNAVVKKEGLTDIETNKPTTILIFKNPLSDKDKLFYEELTLSELKQNLKNRYLENFCENRSSLPKIILQKTIYGTVVEELEIKSEDIPQYEKEEPIKIYYSRIKEDGKSVEKTDRFETFNIKGFKISKDELKKNAIHLTSKGELGKKLDLINLSENDVIKGNRYLFLLSSNFIDERDSDTRGDLNIPKLEDFKKKINELDPRFHEEEILYDDLEFKANEVKEKMFPEILERKKEKDKDVERLKQMFYLSEETLRKVSVNLNDSDEDILKKVYKADAELVAKKDAEIKKRIEALDQLNPNSKDFNDNFIKEVEELTKAIPLQDRTQLAHYVARRNLILELFGKILDKKLLIQVNSNRNNDEAIIHNLLFQKRSNSPEESDLWIINEDFIYFSGTSDTALNKIKVQGELFFKDDFTKAEEAYLKSLSENRKIKKPDVLLFPDEGKCIIIEFKAPDVNASDHLTQINKYAYLIRNFTKDKFQITTFYGYLIGESIEPDDVIGTVSSFEYSYQFDYLYQPATKVVGRSGRSDGSIYTEVIKYSTLLNRAKMRNKIFKNKLGI